MSKDIQAYKYARNVLERLDELVVNNKFSDEEIKKDLLCEDAYTLHVPVIKKFERENLVQKSLILGWSGGFLAGVG